jgi:hypothetical protein
LRKSLPDGYHNVVSDQFFFNFLVYPRIVPPIYGLAEKQQQYAWAIHQSKEFAECRLPDIGLKQIKPFGTTSFIATRRFAYFEWARKLT